MPLYRYRALSEEGKSLSATLNADSLLDAKQKLLQRKILAFKIDLVSEKDLNRGLAKKDVLALTRELARLLQAGLPLFEAISALEEKYRGHKSHRILLDVGEWVKTGHSFSSGLSRHFRSFDILYISMVANAEKTGRLALCLDELSALMERQLHVKKQVMTALLYPAILSVFCLVVLSSLLFFVIPSLQELFEGRDLHFFTRIVFATSRLACESKSVLLILSILFTGLVIAASLIRSWKEKLIRIVLRMPIAKTLFAKVAFVRFSRAAATLLEGGLPLIAAFSQARTVMRHADLEQIIFRAEIKIAQGESLSASFSNHLLIPPLIPRMLGIAEQSGKLSFTMQQIAQIYEDELETTLSRFATVAQPVLLLFLGALVGFVLLSVLLPLTDVGSFVD